MYHAWYSESQEQTLNEHGCAASIYLTESGEEIKITEVRNIESGDQPTSRQEDLRYLGLVVKWIRESDPIIDLDRYSQARQIRLEQERQHRRFPDHFVTNDVSKLDDEVEPPKSQDVVDLMESLKESLRQKRGYK